MISRFIFGALVGMGVCACAQADSETGAEDAAYSIEDVQAAPEAWREVDPENLVVFETTKGRIVIELLPEIAPLHVTQFKAYVRGGHYDDTPFHRVIRNFMAQGGDIEQRHGAEVLLEPTPKEFTFRRDPAAMVIDPIGPADSAKGGLYNGFPIETQAQFMADTMWSKDSKVESWMPHCKGVLSTARYGEGPGVSKELAENSGNAQFFLISGDGRHLDKQYTPKGRVLEGLDVVQSIKLGPPGDGYPIDNPDVLQTARLAADLPDSDRITAYVQRTNTQDWADRFAAADQLGSDVCSLSPVPAVID